MTLRAHPLHRRLLGHEHRQEVLATLKVQQWQLDTVQAQLREVTEAVTELFQKQSQIHDVLGRRLSDLASLKARIQAPEESIVEDFPATQPNH